MKKLYKLKSNLKTIVSYKDGFTKVEWSESMFSGYDSRWIVSHPRNTDNLIPLTESEMKEYESNLKTFLEQKEIDSRLSWS